MRPDQAFRDLILSVEGLRLEMYHDTGGRPTIGVGHLLSADELRTGQVILGQQAVGWRTGLSRGQCLALLDQDSAWAAKDVTEMVSVPLTQHQFDALTSFVFNVGPVKFASSTLRRVLNQCHYELVPGQLRRWVYDGTTREQGLVTRREREAALFLRP